jgi:formyltetrahydrofolate deformylase
MTTGDRGILLLRCSDRKGVVAAVSGFISDHNGNITSADEHQDQELNLYFLRLEWTLTEFDVDLSSFEGAFAPIAREFSMTWSVARSSDRPRVGILVSKSGHCLADLLYRHQIGELPCDIRLVIGNHDDLRKITEFYGIAFHHVKASDDKLAAEKSMLSLLHAGEIELVVLARYMQVLSNDFVARYPNAMINVHHSFLPAFIGAKPYHRSYERGVKLIGATSHYVTAELDDGPIIEQDVVRVTHGDSLESIIRKGGDAERAVLTRAVRWHVENRIMVYGRKTVVFAN